MKLKGVIFLCEDRSESFFTPFLLFFLAMIFQTCTKILLSDRRVLCSRSLDSTSYFVAMGFKFAVYS